MATTSMIYAPIKDGKVVDTTSQSSLSTEKTQSNSSLDREAFLSLLVAEMQYQDPLQPTTNTEYISQFATFSQLEAVQNMEAVEKKAMANDLVGKQVILKVVSNVTGETTYESGRVDYIYVENNKTFLSVGENLYSIDDLDSVVDEKYLDAVNLSTVINTLIKKLPANITLENEAAVNTIREAFDELDDYQKSFITKENVEKLENAEQVIAGLKSPKEPENEGEAEGESGETK